MTLTIERLKQVYTYEPETGTFTRAIDRWCKYKAGQIAGTLDRTNGYRKITVDRKGYSAHRVAFFYMTGAWPKQVDHINGDRTDNRWCNLRAATPRLNNQNYRAATSKSVTGLLGAHISGEKFRSSIKLPDGRTLCIGTFDTAQAAHEAYVLVKRRVHEGCTL